MLKWLLFIGVAFAIVIAVTINTAETAGPPPPKTEAQLRDLAAGACIMITEKQLNDPKSAEFPLARDAGVTKTKDGLWKVSFDGRAKNGFGALMLKTFRCTMAFDEATQNWTAINLSE